MKNLILLVFVLSASIAFAQNPTVAMDFTANDCDGASHNLFSDLDAGNVVLMEFIMLDPCLSCVKARESLQPMFQQFEASHPGRFRIFTTGWTNSITCTQMQNWMQKHTFSNVFFPGNGDMTDYYGGMGMPTIALVAGKDHKVLYLSDVNNGFDKADTTTIKALIAETLVASDVKPIILKDEIRLFPNPASDYIRIAISSLEAIGEVRILNALGQTVGSRAVGVNGEVLVAGLPAGLYSIVYSIDGQEQRGRFVKR